MIRSYFDLAQTYKSRYGCNTILYMQCGSFYEIYGIKNKITNQIVDNVSNIEEFSKLTEYAIVDKKVSCEMNVYENIIDNKKVSSSDTDKIALSIVMAGFKTFLLDKFVTKLQSSGYTVVVYTQKEQKEKSERFCSGIYSPGTLFDDSMVSTQLSNNISCIWIEETSKIYKKIHIGFSNIDVFTGKVNIYEFDTEYMSKNPCSFDILEQLITFYNPSEYIIIHDIDDIYVRNNIINYVGLNKCLKGHIINLSSSNREPCDNDNCGNTFLKSMASNSSKQIYQNSIIYKFYENEYHAQQTFDLITEYPIAGQSLVFLFEFIESQNPSFVKMLSLPEIDNYENKCHLANHSAKQLNIIHERQTSSTRQGSNALSNIFSDTVTAGSRFNISSILNMCKTNMGKRKFSHVLLKPTRNINILENSYNEIQTSLLCQFDVLWEPLLSHIKDIEKIYRKSIISTLTPLDFHNIYITVNNVTHIIIEKQKSVNINNIQQHENISIKDKNILCYIRDINQFINTKFNVSMIENINFSTFKNKWLFSTDEDEDVVVNDDEIINVDSYSNLKEVREIKVMLKKCLKNTVCYFNNIVGKFEKSKNSQQFVKLSYTPSNGLKIILTKRRCTNLKAELVALKNKIITIPDTNFEINVDNLQFKQHTTKNEIYITSLEIERLINEIQENNEIYSSTLQECYDDIILEFSNYNDMIEEIIEYIINCDILFCKTKMARTLNLSKPIIKDINSSSSSYVKFQGLRHLIIEKLNQEELYITNDIEIGTKEQLGVLLFGTNAVGKTSFIKAIGIAVIMAQAGFYVPCQHMEYYPYEYIFTRIIGNDNIYKNLSTFAVEMSELRVILNKCNQNSLILGDELCSGTENDSAISIITSSLEHFHKHNSNYIFATHFHELVDMDEINALNGISFKHMQVHYDQSRQCLVYNRKLMEGHGDSIYGLEVCKSLHLSNDFISRSFEIRNKYMKFKKSSTQYNILQCETSKYNSKKIKDICEICKKNKASEVHHLLHQKNADTETNYIKNTDYNFHKNHKANLCNICEECHDEIHRSNIQYVRMKTDKGYDLFKVV